MRKIIVTLAALLMCIGAFCQNGYKKASFTYGGVTLPYRYLEPNVKQNECYPLVLFLHGAGERGNDNQARVQIYVDCIDDHCLLLIQQRRVPIWPCGHVSGSLHVL